MKLFIIIGLFFPLICTGCSNTKKDISTQDADFSTNVARFYEEPEGSKDSPYYQFMHEIFDALFKPEAIKIDFVGYREISSKKEVTLSGTVWFSKGLLYIQQTADTNSYEKNNICNNFATVNGKVYSWNTHTHKGKVYERSPADTLEFLVYFVDGAAFKTCFYSDYLKHPVNFKVTESGAIKTIEATDQKYLSNGFEGIQILENPLWLYSIMFENNADSSRETITFERPQPIDKIPDEVKKLPDSIIFEESDYTLEVLMEYL